VRPAGNWKWTSCDRLRLRPSRRTATSALYMMSRPLTSRRIGRPFVSSKNQDGLRRRHILVRGSKRQLWEWLA
jgi:hypothetical protein